MFRALPPAAQAPETLVALGEKLSEPRRAGAGQNNAAIPVGYTYLGQFIDHDITFDPVSRLQRLNDPDALHDFRSPRYDLDSLYGSGPSDSPFLYEWRDPEFRGIRLLVGRNPDTNDRGEALERIDLLRNRQERAIIGDPRNDENIIMGQLQLAFVRFHNQTVALLREKRPALRGRALFEAASRLVRWHYQWVVVRDFLPRIVGRTLANQVVRPSYGLNEIVRDVPIFAARERPGQLEHLGGFRALPAAWTIEWRRFVKIGNSRPQLSRKINTKLAGPLMKLPREIDPARRSLATLNLLRGRALQLPSGQAVAGAIGLPPLATGQLGLGRFGLSAARRAELEASTPLWYYVLREAEVGGGERLGPVGGRIVAEVLVGLLKGDSQSFLSQEPTWKPELIPAARRGQFTLSDLLKFATT
jgi:Animal haem peroxidase